MDFAPRLHLPRLPQSLMHRLPDEQRIVLRNLLTTLPLHAQMIIARQMSQPIMTDVQVLIMPICQRASAPKRI